MDKKTEKLIKNILREGTIKWGTKNQCLKNASTRVRMGNFKNGRPKYKLHWRCAKCGKLSPSADEFEVDHIVEIGSFTGNWDSYINRMYCDLDNLQVLCVDCHGKKTSSFNMKRLRGTRDVDLI